MDADLDPLLIAVFCTADDVLLSKPYNARRIVTDAEVVTLCVAQAIMGITSDPRFVAVAATRLAHLFPQIPQRSGFYKRRERLSDTIEALIDEFARHSPGYDDDLLLVDSTPVECCRSRETVKRGAASSLPDALADAADYGYCASHSRYFFGFRLHALFALRHARALALTSPQGRRTRRRAGPAGPCPTRRACRRNRRQGLRRQGLRSRRRRHRRHDRAPAP
jgi:hypothetical protein